MRDVTIRRCPTCPNIGSHTDQITAALRNDPNLNVRVVDGNKGEFNVEVDGKTINGTSGASLRTPNEVAAEIRGAEVTSAG